MQPASAVFLLCREALGLKKFVGVTLPTAILDIEPISVEVQ
ncbi:hypothetical protein [Nostoc sp.]